MTVALDIIGISIQLVSTFLAALAYVLQKKAHIRFSTSGVDAWTAPVNKSALRLWQIGFVLMVVCALLDLATYPMLDLSKQAPLGAATLVFNSILASIMLAEPFTVLDLISTVMIGSGTITAVANSEAESASFTFAGILDLLDDTLVKWYSGFVVPGLILSAVFIERVSRTSPGDWSPSQRRAMALLSPAAGGMFMGFTAYFAKSLSTVVTGGEWFEFKNPVLYLYAVLAAVSVSGQLRYLNKGLAFFDALQVVPIFQCFIIFSNALAGIVYFHDMRTAATYKLVLFAVGGGVCIAGIALLLLKKTSSAAHTSDVAATVVAAATHDVDVAAHEANPLSKSQSRRGSALEMHGHMGHTGHMGGSGSAPNLPGSAGDSVGTSGGTAYRMTEGGVSNPAEVDLMTALQRRIWAAQATAKAAVMGTTPYQPANGGGAAPAGAAADAAGGAGGAPGDGSGAVGGAGVHHGDDAIRSSSSFGSALRRIANAPFAMVTGSSSNSSSNAGSGAAGTAGSAAAGNAGAAGAAGAGPSRRMSSRSRAGSLAASALAAFSHAISSSDVIAAASAHETVALATGTGAGTGAAAPGGAGHADGASGGSNSMAGSAASPGAGPSASPDGSGPAPSPRSVGAAADGSGAGAPAPLRLRGRSRGPSLAPVDEEEAGVASAAATPAVTGATASAASVESIAAGAAAAFAGAAGGNGSSSGNDSLSLLGGSGRAFPSYGSAGRGSFADSVGSGGAPAGGSNGGAPGAAESDPWGASGAIARPGAPLGSPGHSSATGGAGAFGWSDSMSALPGSTGASSSARQGAGSSLPPPPHAAAGARSSGPAVPLAWHEVEVKDIAKALWKRFGPASKMVRRGSYTEMDGGPPLTAAAK